jgi:cyclic beta-1,2-glucan synthetase
MYRAGIEGILGLRREGGDLVVDPRIPDTWPGFEATVTVAGIRCDIRVRTADASAGERSAATLDGAPIAAGAGAARIPLDGASHALVITLTRKSARPQCDGGH